MKVETYQLFTASIVYNTMLLALIVRLIGLHDTILTNSSVFRLGHCVNFKAMGYESTRFSTIVADKSHHVTLALGDMICLADSFVLTLGHFVNFKAMRYNSKSFSGIVGDKSHQVTYPYLIRFVKPILFKVRPFTGKSFLFPGRVFTLFACVKERR